MEKMPFGKKNYQWMVIGLVTLVIGFIVMSLDNQDYGFGFFGLTLGPIIVMAGFIMEIYAILIRPEVPKSDAKK
ncbi:MAG: DUF3098 domain-containing protein [Cyclobacteriaceae bacterium]|nr:DUF3098 domain-containing protein [Cyclobacteriaceae bacterium]